MCSRGNGKSILVDHPYHNLIWHDEQNSVLTVQHLCFTIIISQGSTNGIQSHVFYAKLLIRDSHSKYRHLKMQVNQHLDQQSSQTRRNSANKAISASSTSIGRFPRSRGSAAGARPRSHAARGSGTSLRGGGAAHGHGSTAGAHSFGVLVALGLLGLDAGALIYADGLQLFALGLDDGAGGRCRRG